jgi:hypothetical protein
MSSATGGHHETLDHFREDAENCAQLAERATDEPTYLRYRRMEESWRTLAEEQDWLDGNLRTSEGRE